MAENYMPAGAIPKLTALIERWRRRGGAEPADVASVPLGREETREERMTRLGQEAQMGRDAEFGNPMDYLLKGLANPGGLAMFLGPMAKLAPDYRISKAMSLAQQGLSRDEVRTATGGAGLPGIHFGKEGIPRWEISDIPLRLTDEMIAALAQVRPGYDIQGDLERVVSHPEYFQNYPMLRGIRTTITPTAGYRSGAAFNPDRMEIMVQGDPRRFRSMLAHEMQHGVQKVEGMARGGGPEQMKQDAADILLDPISDKLRALERLHLEREWAKGKFKTLYDENGRIADDAYNSLAPLWGTPTYAALQDKWRSIMRILENPQEVFRLYERLAGETEARNTQKRLDMMLRDRADVRPWRTQDIPDELQILRRFEP